MQKLTLRKSGLEISALGLAVRVCATAMDRPLTNRMQSNSAFERGVTFFDTADRYLIC